MRLIYNQRVYPCRILTFFGQFFVIAPLPLHDRLRDCSGRFHSEQCRELDAQVFFYASQEQLQLNDLQLLALLFGHEIPA